MGAIYRDPLSCIGACIGAFFALVVFTIGLITGQAECSRDQFIHLSTWLIVYAILLLTGIVFSAVANVRSVWVRVGWVVFTALWLIWIIIGAIMTVGGASDCTGVLRVFSIIALLVGFILILSAACMLVSITSAREAAYEQSRMTATNSMHDARRYALMNRQRREGVHISGTVIGAQYAQPPKEKEYRFLSSEKREVGMP